MCLQANRNSFTVVILDSRSTLKGPDTIRRKTRFVESLLEVLISAVSLPKHFGSLKYYLKTLINKSYTNIHL